MDNFTIIEFIGEGSFGRVFKAKEKDSPAIVALKVIRKKGRSSKELKSLRQECDIQRHLDHPNIIRMLDSFETDTEMVVVTEFAEKELHSVLAKEGSLSEDQARAITWDLVSALYYLHSHRVLHRDLKPQNVLIDKSGHAKLCDFGLARNMTAATHVLTSIKGTPLYMAPELIDEKPYDHQADLWSLGCIVYELMAGQPPFCTTSIVQLVKMIRHKAVQWPTFITPEAFSFLQGLLHKDPASRMGWPEILAHPFVADHIFIHPEDMQCDSPFTRPLSESQMEAKQLQTAKLNNPQKVITQAVQILQKREHRVQSGRALMHALENIQMSEDDSIRAMSALSIRDSLKTDDEDHSQPMTAANAKLLQHEYKVLDQQNLVLCNLENNMAQLCQTKNPNTKKDALPNSKEAVLKMPVKLATKTEKEEPVKTPVKLATKTEKEDDIKMSVMQATKVDKDAGAKTSVKLANKIELYDIAGYSKGENKQKTEINENFKMPTMLGTSSEESSTNKERKASKSMGSTKTESSKHTVDTKGLSKSVPPSYKQKFLQFSLEKLKIGSSTNRLTRSIKKSLTFNWGSDKGKLRNKRRMSEPVVLDSSQSCTDYEGESLGDESTSSTKGEEVAIPKKDSESGFANSTEKMSDYELIAKYYDNCKPVLKEPLATAVELEEWQAFVYSTMQEVVAGDVTFLTQLNTVNMVLGFLRRAGADGGKLCGSIATLLSLPMVTQVTREQLMDILDIYSETHVTLNLVYAIWVLMQGYNPCEPQDCEVRMDGVSKLVELLCALTIRSPPATRYMCCGFIALHAASHLALIISLHEKHQRVSMNVIALMISILQELPENSRLVEEILFGVPKLDLLQFLFHSNNVFKVRMCVLVSLLCTYCCRALCTALKDVWTREHKEILESWQSHSYELLSHAAKYTILELSNMPFYKSVF